MKKIFVFVVLVFLLLTAGCAGPQEHSAQPGASRAGIIAPAFGGNGFSKSAPSSVNETVSFIERANDSGQGDTDYSARLTLLDVLRGTAAYDKMRQSNPYYMIDIQPDREFIAARFKYELTDTSRSGVPRLVNRDSFAIYRDGQFDTEDNKYIMGVTPDFYGKAKKGDVVDGWITFTVPKGASWPLIVYGKASAGSDGIWFKTG